MPANLNCLPQVIFSGLKICEWLIRRKCLKLLGLFLFPFETEFKRWPDCKVLEYKSADENSVFYSVTFLCVTLSQSLNLCFASFLCVENSICKTGIKLKKIKWKWGSDIVSKILCICSMTERPLQRQSRQLARLVCKNTLRERFKARKTVHLWKEVGKRWVFLDMHILAVQVCPGSVYTCSWNTRQAWKRRDPGILPERAWVSTRTCKNYNLNSWLLPRYCEFAKLDLKSTLSLKHLQSPALKLSLCVRQNQTVWRVCDINFAMKYALVACLSKPQSDMSHKILPVTIKNPTAPHKMPFSCHFKYNSNLLLVSRSIFLF